MIYDSTLYPGFTEEACVPILERESGLRFNANEPASGVLLDLKGIVPRELGALRL